MRISACVCVRDDIKIKRLAHMRFCVSASECVGGCRSQQQ